ncbi:MAG: DUF402 domain-containing protein [Chloroflexi bacterium]|nr:DUF402 domain-containing protein [Chloroflexota bacterium]
MEHSRYSRGEAIVLREIWDEKIWIARPATVIQDSPELIATYVPPNTHAKRHCGAHGDHVTAQERRDKEWGLQDVVSAHFPVIKLVIPGESYSVLIFRNEGDDSFRCWYINLEDPEAPMHRTAVGFDCTDLLLDMVVEPNLKDWRWDDEDELQEAVESGLISQAKAKSLYAKGEEVRDLLMSGKSVFNGWEHWHPDRSWKAPTLPAGWDIL